MSTDPKPAVAASGHEPRRRWLVLADGVAHDDLDDALGHAGFRLVNCVPRTEMHPWQRIFAQAGGAVFVHDVVDHVLGARYLALIGGELDALERELARCLPRLDTAAIVERCFDPDKRAAACALRLLGLAAADHPKGAEWAALRRWRRSSDPVLREAADSAAAFAGCEVEDAGEQ